MIDSCGQSQVIDSPTRISEVSKSLLDLIITDSVNFIAETGILSPVGTSDHSVVYCKVKTPRIEYKRHKRTIWDYKRCDFVALNNSLRSAPFNLGYELFIKADDVVNYWIQLYNSTIVEFIPNKTVSIKTHDKPWVTHEFKMLIRKRNRLLKCYKITGKEAHYQTYKRVRNAAVTLNRQNIKQYHRHTETQLSVCTDPKLWWHRVKNFLLKLHSVYHQLSIMVQ